MECGSSRATVFVNKCLPVYYKTNSNASGTLNTANISTYGLISTVCLFVCSFIGTHWKEIVLNGVSLGWGGGHHPSTSWLTWGGVTSQVLTLAKVGAERESSLAILLESIWGVSVLPLNLSKGDHGLLLQLQKRSRRDILLAPEQGTNPSLALTHHQLSNPVLDRAPGQGRSAGGDREAARHWPPPQRSGSA